MFRITRGFWRDAAGTRGEVMGFARALPILRVTEASLRGALATKQSIVATKRKRWIASRSLSSGAHSRPLARNDALRHVDSRHEFKTPRREAPELCVDCHPR